MKSNNDGAFFTTANTENALHNVMYNQTYYGENFGDIQPSNMPPVEEETTSYVNSDAAAAMADQSFQAQNDFETQLVVNDADLISINQQNDPIVVSVQVNEVVQVGVEISNQAASNLNGTSISTENIFNNQYT